MSGALSETSLVSRRRHSFFCRLKQLRPLHVTSPQRRARRNSPGPISPPACRDVHPYHIKAEVGMAPCGHNYLAPFLLPFTVGVICLYADSGYASQRAKAVATFPLKAIPPAIRVLWYNISIREGSYDTEEAHRRAAHLSLELLPQFSDWRALVPQTLKGPPRREPFGAYCVQATSRT
jgi:hypothetical protein